MDCPYALLMPENGVESHSLLERSGIQDAETETEELVMLA
jgi:hypothetical protein